MSTINILSCYHLLKTLSSTIAQYHINPWLTNRSLERESQSTGFLFLDLLVSEKLPSLKGSNVTYNQNRWPFDTDTFINLSLSGFWKIPSLQSTVPLFSRCTRGMLRQNFNYFHSFMGSWHKMKLGHPKQNNPPSRGLNEQCSGLVIFTYTHITDHQVGPATNIQLNLEDTGGVFR